MKVLLLLQTLIGIMLVSNVRASDLADSYPHVLEGEKSAVFKALKKKFVVFSTDGDEVVFVAKDADSETATITDIHAKFVSGICVSVLYKTLRETTAAEAEKIVKHLVPNENWGVNSKSKEAIIFNFAWKTGDGKYFAFLNDRRHGNPLLAYQFVRAQTPIGICIHTHSITR